MRQKEIEPQLGLKRKETHNTTCGFLTTNRHSQPARKMWLNHAPQILFLLLESFSYQSLSYHHSNGNGDHKTWKFLIIDTCSWFCKACSFYC